MTIGDKIKQARTLRGLTQDELGNMIDLPRQRIAQYECGVRTPKSTQLGQIASALNVPVEYFKEHHTDTYTDLLYSLFELEKLYDLKLLEHEGRICLAFNDAAINHYLKEWINAKNHSMQSETTKKAYEEWKMCFPGRNAE